MINANEHKNISEGKTNEIKCVFCKSSDYIKKGYRQTEQRGKIPRYYCKECGKNFTNDEGFYRMRYSAKTITLSIDIFVSNLSSRKMRNQLLRHFDTKVSHISILDWVRKYTLKVKKFVDKLGYNLGDSFYADETEVQREGKRDRFWCCLDWDTRLITGYHYSLNGNITQAQEFIKKSIAKGKPKFIQTDAAQFYPKAFQKLFYSNKFGGLTVEHKIQNYQKTRIHNYKIETVFMKIKDRVIDFRGFKALWSAPILMTALVIQHNFIEVHSGTSEIPFERAGVEVDLGENRWLGLIKLATRNN